MVFVVRLCMYSKLGTLPCTLGQPFGNQGRRLTVQVRGKKAFVFGGFSEEFALNLINLEPYSAYGHWAKVVPLPSLSSLGVGGWG